MRSIAVLSGAMVCLARLAGAAEVGLSGPSVWNGDADGAVAAARAVEATGTSWTRIDFRLDVWSAPDDPTARGPQKLSWFAAYDRLVDELTTHGVQVYALVGGGSTPGGGEPDSDDYVTRYTNATVKIVDHFKDRVRVYELFNEPNNWRAGTTRPAVSPYYLAKMWQSIYLAVKHDGGRSHDPCDQVTLVSGALFSFEGTDAASYLTEVYQAGRGQLAWDWMRSNVGSYPLDGIGYHIYVGQGASATAASVSAGIAKNLAGIWSAIGGLEPAGTTKKIWLSEFGWTTAQVSPAQQTQFLTASFDAFAADSHVEAALWFTYQDFPGGDYGLYGSKGLSPADRHAGVYAAFTAAAAKYPAARNATFAADDLPMTLTAGETRTLTLGIKNLGASAWSRAALHRLGAASGCPSAAATNQLAIAPGATGGYAQSPTDGRLFLGATADIKPGDTATLAFAITAPTQPGSYEVAFRMVQEGQAWFGDTFRRTLEVVPPTGASAGGAAPGSAGKADGKGGPMTARGDGQMAAAGCLVGSPAPPAPVAILIAGIFLIVLSRRPRT